MPSPVNADTLLGSEQRHDLRVIQFSRRGAFLCVLEDAADRCLYLSLSRSPNMWMQRKNLVRMVPMADNREVSYTYDVTPGKLTIRTWNSCIEMCFGRNGNLRIRGGGAHLRFCFRMMLFENCAPKENGAMEVAFTILGKLLFVPLKGGLFCNARWSPEQSRSNDFIMELLPCAESGSYEAAVHEYNSNGSCLSEYETFDTCVVDATEDFERFRTRFPNVPARYAATARLASWVIWMHTLGPHGLLAHEVVYMTRTQWVRAFGWQQSYQAMAASGDIRASWQLLLTMFDYQDPTGQLPDSAGDLDAAYMVSKPALQGLALDYLLSRANLRSVPRKDCLQLYEGMTKFTNWWLTARDRSKSGLPQYYHSDESPGEFCTVFQDGLPMHSGDLIAFIALMAEGCGRLAARLGCKERAEFWRRKSEDLIRRLVDEFWDGERFLSRVVKTGHAVKSDSILSMLPIVLGKRLPETIVDAVARHLSDEKEYLAPCGITVESMRGSGADTNHPGPKGAMTYISTLVCIGLWNAGKTDLAKAIAQRCCDQIAQEGFVFMKSSVAAHSADTAIKPLPHRKESSIVDPWSSWTAACFFILAGMLQTD